MIKIDKVSVSSQSAIDKPIQCIKQKKQRI